METTCINGFGTRHDEFETPFADEKIAWDENENLESKNLDVQQFFQEWESPFAKTFEKSCTSTNQSPLAQEYVQFMGELHDSEFSNTLDELAAELEDTWSNKISNELLMGETFIPFATTQAQEYFAPLYRETDNMIDRVAEHFSGNNFSNHSEAEIDRFFSEFEFQTAGFSPVQEQLFGSIFKKVKSVVSKGIDLAKKGINAVGKILPVNIILGKLKGLIRPLLDKVLKFAIDKLPKKYQPYAQTLSKKFLSLETNEETILEGNEVLSSGNLDAIQSELDSYISNLVFSGEETEAEELVMNYETSSDTVEREMNYETGGLNIPSLEEGRQKLINELKNLQEGESPAPAIDRFLPVAIMALKPVIKMALSVIGRQRVINFLAGILAKLVGKFVPENVAKPLAASIINTGMSTIGFETYEMDKADVAYEAIVNTIQDSIQNIGELNEETLNDNEALTGQLLEAFETAAANNFPSQYIKESVRKPTKPGLWVLKPRNGPRHYYKKYTTVFDAAITPQVASALKTFKGAPLSNFLRDKLGLDAVKTIQARVHLYEAINGTRLSRVNKYEKVPGLGQAHGNVQFHPLTKEAAAMLLNEPALGKDYAAKFTSKRHRTAVGQRFYYLEITGARLRITQNLSRGAKVASTSDVQAVINFVKSEIKFNYYFSEEEAKTVVEKLNGNDYSGAVMSIRQSVKNVLNDMLLKNISNKVKIIHEAMPEMFLENYTDMQEQFSFKSIGKAVSGVSLNAGKELIGKLIEKLTEKLSSLACDALAGYFKARAAEFKQAQAGPQDGVTVQIIWANVQGMAAIKSVINAIRGNLSIPNLSDLSLPNISTPEIKATAGKKFE